MLLFVSNWIKQLPMISSHLLPWLQDQDTRFTQFCFPSYSNHAPSFTYSRASTNDIQHIRPTIEHRERSRVQTVVWYRIGQFVEGNRRVILFVWDSSAVDNDDRLGRMLCEWLVMFYRVLRGWHSTKFTGIWKATITRWLETIYEI